MRQRIIDGYNDIALIEAFESFASRDLLFPVLDHLPTAPCAVLDIGAGTGRDAAWFAAQGHHVTAVEPAATLREAGQVAHPEVTWHEDLFPHLHRVQSLDRRYDLITVNAVWHHLTPEERQTALGVMRNLLSPGGRLILSLRHGPTSSARPGYDAPPNDTVYFAETVGLTCVAHVAAGSVQPRNVAAGVTWTWLVFAA